MAWRKKLRPRIVTFTKGWSEAYELFLKGEADMVVSYTTSPAYHIAAEGKMNYKAAIFAEGHYLQIETMALHKTSGQANSASVFSPSCSRMRRRRSCLKATGCCRCECRLRVACLVQGLEPAGKRARLPAR